MNTQSENIGDLAAALAKAQAEVGTVHKDSANPFYKNSYASLAAVWEATRPILSKHQLSVVQMPSSDERGYYVETQLMHSSGQWIRSRTYMKPAKDDPQGIGSLISYARRYALQAVTMICPDDDDGEAAMGRNSNAPQKPVESPKPVQKVEPAKPQEKKPTEAPKAKEVASKFNGENHQALFQELMKLGYTPEEFLEAHKWAKDERVPAQAKDFYKMSDNTSSLFLFDGMDAIKKTIVAYKAIAA
jgi:hypothetical protein